MLPRRHLLGWLLAAIVGWALLDDSKVDLPFFLLGLVPAAIVFVPLFLARSRGGADPEPRWVVFRRAVVGEARRALAALSWRGGVWSVTLPVAWLLVFYGFVVHVRLDLGRWPTFGEPLEGVLLDLHGRICWRGLGAMIASLMPVAGVFVVCLFLRRWRPISVYALGYAAAVGLAFGGIYLAPGPFLNWFFD